MSANMLVNYIIRANRCDVAAVTRATRNSTLAGMRAAWAQRYPGAKSPTSRQAFIAYACAHEAPYV